MLIIQSPFSAETDRNRKETEEVETKSYQGKKTCRHRDQTYCQGEQEVGGGWSRSSGLVDANSFFFFFIVVGFVIH